MNANQSAFDAGFDKEREPLTTPSPRSNLRLWSRTFWRSAMCASWARPSPAAGRSRSHSERPPGPAYWPARLRSPSWVLLPVFGRKRKKYFQNIVKLPRDFVCLIEMFSPETFSAFRRSPHSHLEHRDELLFGDAHSLFITAIYYVNDRIGVCIIASPVRPDTRLTAKVLVMWGKWKNRLEF